MSAGFSAVRDRDPTDPLGSVHQRLIWGIVAYASLRRCDRAAGRSTPAPTVAGTVVALAGGVVLWAAFAFWAHIWLIGVRPFA